MNEENLINIANRTPEEREEISRKGGIASGIARKEKKTAREIAKALLEDNFVEVDGEKISLKEATIRKLLSVAMGEADLPTIKYLFELIGESPAQQIEINNGVMITEEDREYFRKNFGSFV
jgi:hypothetical protein